jgi:hypothetical protein
VIFFPLIFKNKIKLCYYFWAKKPKFQYHKIGGKKKEKKNPGPGIKLNFTISNIGLV